MSGRGRPRLQASPSGRGTREDLLEASARLFARDGFRATTHAIAEAAGVRQATLYHYFANREELLLTLLKETVQPSIDKARSLADRSEPPEVRLWALAHFDVAQLSAGEVNLGALYLLPETEREELADFRAAWSELRESYRTLIAECGTDDERVADLALGLVESIILIRRRVGRGSGDALPEPALVADAVVHLASGRVLDDAQRRTAVALAAAE